MRDFHRFRGPRFRTFDGRNCFGCRRRFGYPYGYAGYYDPYWWWDSGSSYDEDQQREIAEADEMDERSLEEQRMLREENRAANAPRNYRSSTDASVATPAPATLLVFRDQRREEVQNYAIVGQTLWNFASRRTEKIPLAQLDISATTRANDERGVDFRLPN